MELTMLAMIIFVFLILIGLVIVWMDYPGTIFILGGAVVYDLLVRGANLPWQTYLIMFTLLGLGEILDVVLLSYYKKTQRTVNIVKTLAAIAMIIVFVLTL